ncbi:MAG TPA: lipoyl(octanoyl) transferase LipB [Anaerolineales bacterium]
MIERCEVFRLGLVPYETARRLQETLAAEIGRGQRSPALLLLEHPHTYTFGRRGHAENLLWDEAELARRGVSVHWVDRGGDVTYHGPGQLVGYPLLPLVPGGLQAALPGEPPRLPRTDYVGFVRKLEAVLIAALAGLGVAAERVDGLTGVWVRQAASSPEKSPHPLAKIAAIGVKVDARGVSCHGFALNVAPDMNYWNGIIGCGLKDHAVASLAELLDPVPSMEQVMDRVVEAFGRGFEYEMIELAHQAR